MIVLNGFKKKISSPCNITIGVFDALHLGHQLIFKKLKEKQGSAIVITFLNHPLKVLNPQKEIKFIYNLDEKLKLFESYGIDIVVVLKFTKKLANLSYSDFIKLLKEKFAFNYLIGGEDLKIGKEGLGDQNNIKTLQNIYNFKLEIVNKIKYEDKIISSSWIRTLIDEKNYELISKLLNRKYI